MPFDFDWIFFDCFNTLLDDFDVAGEITGMRCIAHAAVETGAFADEAAFLAGYASARRDWLAGHVHEEVKLEDRLGRVAENAGVDPGLFVAHMIDAWETHYPPTVRLGRGVPEMLEAWRGNARMGVVSNYYRPGWPRRLLEMHGLLAPMAFVVDSAEVGWRKPDRRIYEAALDTAGLTLADGPRILFVGDNAECDCKGPSELGMQVLYFDRTGERPNQPPNPGWPAFKNWGHFRPGMKKEDFLTGFTR